MIKMTKQQAIFNWSGGKDSALSLYKILHSEEYEIKCLLTSINEQFRRISMHGVREELLIQQAESIGIPLVKMYLPEMPSMDDYESVMKNTLLPLKNDGATNSIFGDIFLEDLRQYRENKLAELNLKGVFPLWKIPTKEIIHEFLDLGFKTITTCVNDKYLDKSFVGRIIDEDFLNDLPPNVDPCGENGEFHTFVYDGPIFKNPIPFKIGEIIYRKYTSTAPKDDDDYHCNDSTTDNPFDNGFWYCDLVEKFKMAD